MDTISSWGQQPWHFQTSAFQGILYHPLALTFFPAPTLSWTLKWWLRTERLTANYSQHFYEWWVMNQPQLTSQDWEKYSSIDIRNSFDSCYICRRTNSFTWRKLNGHQRNSKDNASETAQLFELWNVIEKCMRITFLWES